MVLAKQDVQEIVADTIELDELCVTAIKSRAMAGNATSVTRIDEKEIEEHNLMTVRSMSNLVPNFYMPDYGSRITSSIYVRGIGARMDHPAVGLNVDNVPIINKDAYDFDMPDIECVEMFRGPQSTLYGRNTMGGLINITTLSPLRYQGLRFLLEYGSGNTSKVAASWYHKFNQDMGLSLNGYFTSSSGFYDNEYNGEKCDHETMWSGRLKYEWRISDSVMLQNVFSVSDLHQGGYPYEYVPTGEIAYNDTCFYKRLSINDGLTVKWISDRFTLSSISSVQYINDNMTLDQDFLPLDYFTLTQAKKEWAITQDLVIKNSGFNRYKWLFGMFGFYKHLDMNAPVTFKDYGISRLIEDHRNQANPEYPIRWNDRTFPLNSNFKNPTWGMAVYHQSDLNLGSWYFVLGLRLDYESAELDYRSYCSTSYNVYKHNNVSGKDDLYRTANIEIDETGHLSQDFIELLPKLSISYNFGQSEMSNLFVSVAKGYKAGGFNTQMFSDVLQQKLMSKMGVGTMYEVEDIVSYKPEQSWNYEFGVHHTVLENRITADLSLFYIDCKDQQLTVFPDGTTTGRMMTNAGKTRSFGVELASKINLLNNWTLNLSYGYTNAKFREYDNGKENFAGKYLPYVPQHTIFAESTYEININTSWLSKIRVSANVNAVGKIYWEESNHIYQPFYALLGGSIVFEGKHYSLDLWGQNLTDTKFTTFYFVSMKNEFLQRGKPLRIGATLRINI